MSKLTALLSLAAVVVLSAAGAAPEAAASQSAYTGTISTVVGGVGGPAKATDVSLNNDEGSVPCGVSYGGGRVQIADAYSVREVDPRTDFLSTPAGTNTEGPVGAGGPATAASLSGACSTAVDRHGNLVIASFTGAGVEVVAHRTGRFYGKSMTAGDIYTVDGDSKLVYPHGVAIDTHGNIVIADSGNNRIRVVAARTGTFYGQAMTAGHMYIVAGNGSLTYSGDGGPALKAGIAFPEGVAVDAAGNLVIADTEDCRVRVVAATTGTFYGQSMTAGDIYTVAGTGTCGFSGDGGPATEAEVNQPQGAAVDDHGNLVITDTYNSRVRVVAATTGTFYGQSMTAGDIYTVAGTGTNGYAGSGVPAASAELDGPQDAAPDGQGNLLIAEVGGWVQVVAATTGTFYGQSMTAGDIYTVAGEGRRSTSGIDGGPATDAQFPGPQGVAVDSAGNVLTSVSSNRVLAVAARTGTFYGQAMTAGHIYRVAGDGLAGFSGDGGPATAAKLSSPQGLAFDSSGNLVITDSGNNRVRVVAATTGTFYGQSMTAGDIYTVAGTGKCKFSGDGGPATSAGLCDPDSVAVDGVGNLVITDDYHYRVRVVAATTGTFYGQSMTAGDIYTVAGDGGPCGFSGDGGPATSAELCDPDSVVVDGAGNLVMTDSGNDRVRVVAATTGTFYGQSMTAGDIYTVAGDGENGSFTNGGPATQSTLALPTGVAVDSSGNLVIVDDYDYLVAVVATSTGTFYGQSMTAGDIYSVVGNGEGGFSGDGGPATAAELNDPVAVAVDAAGDLLIADFSNNRVREVSS